MWRDGVDDMWRLRNQPQTGLQDGEGVGGEMNLSYRLADAILAATWVHEDQEAIKVLQRGFSFLPDEDSAIVGLLEDGVKSGKLNIERHIRSNWGDIVACRLEEKCEK
jgi:hypothetical protein